ncbi:MAG: hypothetical protein EPN53_15045 [Acidobacteria bacterium]|nr:MAG: hypothetical protein EPN53_15045 [Acidobacteriota bacterium]
MRHRPEILAFFLYGALLLALRPATPFEWDEVLYQRALDHYDVAAQYPHPPGVPAYIAVGKAVSFVTRDPMVAMQLVAVASALAALLLLARLGRTLGVPPLAAAAAAGLLAFVPGFLFAANVGLSDVPATAGAIAAVLACVVATRNSARIPLAAVVVAFALSLRPQIVVALLPAGLAAVVMAIRRRHWRPLGLGALAGVGVSAAVWVPAILLTGVSRYIAATRAHLHWMAVAEAGYRLPGLGLKAALGGWLRDPVGSGPMAVVFWLLVVIGAVVWWATGRRWLVVAAVLSGGSYLAVAMFTMNVFSSARYGLPAVAFFALLAGGVTAAPQRWLRRAGLAAVALWSAAAFGWGLPVYLLRREPAPVWAALTWIRAHEDPATTLVVYDGVATPHVRYVLGKAGFRIVEMAKANVVLDGPPRPGAQTLFVTPLPVPGCDVLFDDVWRSARLAQLTFRRYQACAVSRVRGDGGALFSPEWQLRKGGWQLWGTGRIELGAGARPAVVRLCAGGEPISLARPGWPAEAIAPAQCVMVPLLPGAAGALAVSAPADTATLIPPIQILPLAALDVSAGLAPAYLVPQVANLRGFGGAQWRTDLVLFNPQAHPLAVTAQFLATGRDNSSAPEMAGTLAAGQVLNVTDVLSLPAFRGATMGALLVRATAGKAPCAADDCDFLALARTYNAHVTPDLWRSSEWMGGVAPGAALGPGQAAIVRHVTRSARVGASVGVASWSAVPVRVAVTVSDGGGALVERRELELAPFGHLHVPLQADVGDGTVTFEIAAPDAGVRVAPYVSMVDRDTGLPTHLLPDVVPARPFPAHWTPLWPRVAERR